MNIPDITPHGDIKTLPKWAQQYISALRNRAESLTKEIETTKDAKATISWWTASHDSTGIPERATIQFLVGNYRELSINLRDGLLHVNASGGILKVYPRAANDPSIGVEER